MVMKHLIGGSFAGALLLAGAALAQPSAVDEGPNPHRHGAGAADHRAEAMAARQAGLARRLKAVLNLRPEQEDALKAFTQSMTPPKRDWAGAKREDALSAPERADLRLSRMEAHLAFARKRTEALKTFYGQLSPEQKRAFDALEPMRPPHPMGGRHGWRAGRPGGEGL